MKEKAPTWFNVIAIIAFIWNLLGLAAFAGQMLMPPEALDLMPEAERELYESTPTWVNIAFGFAVIGGTLGTLLLILRKKLAKTILILSFAGICAQLFYNLVLANTFEVYGPGGAVMPVMVLVIGFLLILMANKGIKERWLV